MANIYLFGLLSQFLLCLSRLHIAFQVPISLAAGGSGNNAARQGLEIRTEIQYLESPSGLPRAKVWERSSKTLWRLHLFLLSPWRRALSLPTVNKLQLPSPHKGCVMGHLYDSRPRALLLANVWAYLSHHDHWSNILQYFWME